MNKRFKKKPVSLKSTVGNPTRKTLATPKRYDALSKGLTTKQLQLLVDLLNESSHCLSQTQYKLDLIHAVIKARR